MRVVRRKTQRGAIMAITAIALVTLMGAAALAVDVGVGWTIRRNLVTSTDAAALAAAQTFAVGGNGCASSAPTFLGNNAPTATMTLCTTGTSAEAEGTVTVSAEQQVDVYFGRVVGMTPYLADSSTTVRWGPPGSATGLRPIGLCVDGIQSFLANPLVTQTIEISYNEQGNNSGQIEYCADPSMPNQGNWGIVDFNGSPSNSEIKGELLDGYAGAVYTGTPGGTCAAEPYACYDGDPGQGLTNAYKQELNYLKNNNIYFAVPVFDDYIINPGSKQLHLVAFARVRVVAFKLTGSTRSITLEFQPGLISGACCNPGGMSSNAAVLQICAVKESDLSGC